MFSPLITKLGGWQILCDKYNNELIESKLRSSGAKKATLDYPHYTMYLPFK